MNVKEILNRRYATKKFDATKRLTDEQFEQIKALLRWSPSSVNSQPWHFVIADTDAGKARIAKSALEGPYTNNHPKISDASHVVLFCAKTDVDEAYKQKIVAQEEADGRFSNPEGKAAALKGRDFYFNLHRELDDVPCWLKNQVYLNLGNLLLGAGMMGIDAVPIEGVDLPVLNQEFNLTSQGLTALAVVALGYHAEDDFNFNLPKSRFEEAEIFTFA